MMQFLMSRLQLSAISCSALSACSRPRGFPTATARVKLFELDQEIWTEKTGYMNPMADYVPYMTENHERELHNSSSLPGSGIVLITSSVGHSLRGAITLFREIPLPFAWLAPGSGVRRVAALCEGGSDRVVPRPRTVTKLGRPAFLFPMRPGWMPGLGPYHRKVRSKGDAR